MPHDEATLIDAAVLEAYGWSDLLPLLRVAHGSAPSPPAPLPQAGEGREEARRGFDAAVLERLVALNVERAAEEARGLVRWLRPELQNPQAARVPEQTTFAVDEDVSAETSVTPTTPAKPLPWPKDPVEQVRAVADALAAAPGGLALADLETRFSSRGPWKRRLPTLLGMLVAVGRLRERDGRFYTAA